MMEILLAELENERSKLQKHRSMLSDRISYLEVTAFGHASFAGGAAVSSVMNACEETPAAGGAPTHAPAAVDNGAFGANGAASATSQVESAAAPESSPPPPPTPASPSRAVPGVVSEAPMALAQGVALGSVSEAAGTSALLPTPEELLLRQLPAGAVHLTWFYDEQVLEQVANPQCPLYSLRFEVRQQSEGANGRLRARTHTCDAIAFGGGGEEVGEQSFVVEGCAPGRAYAFSVRAVAEFAAWPCLLCVLRPRHCGRLSCGFAGSCCCVWACGLRHSQLCAQRASFAR